MLALFFLLSAWWLGTGIERRLRLTRGDAIVGLSAGFMLGCFFATWIAFLLALAAGRLGTGVVTLAAALSALLAWRLDPCGPRGVFRMGGDRPLEASFWRAAAFPTAVLTVYFATCITQADTGDIFFRGNSRDFAYHLGALQAFLHQPGFPPENPQAAGASLSYHFMANFFTAVLARGGWPPFLAQKLPMVPLAFSLCVLTCHFFHQSARSRPATFFAAGLFFFGHIGLINLAFGLAGWPAGDKPADLGSWASIEDHVCYPYHNFLNVVIDYFQPQLPFLFAFPLAALLLTVLVRELASEENSDGALRLALAAVGLMPLFHMHTFLTLAPVAGAAGLLRLVRPGPARRVPLAVLAFAAAMAAAAQMAFVLSQEKAPGFSGFDVAERLGPLPEVPAWLGVQRPWLWLRAAGSTLVPGLAGLALSLALLRRGSTAAERRRERVLLGLFAVTAGFFLLINFYRFTPNWGDSNKFFLYLNLLLCLYAGRLLARAWSARAAALRLAAAAALLGFALVPTAIEFSLRYRRDPERLLSADEGVMAAWIRLNTPPGAVFLTAHAYVQPVPALAGRRVVNGSYTRETGYSDDEIERLVARAYRLADPSLITRARVTHVLIGPDEQAAYYVNRPAWERRHRQVFDLTSRGARFTLFEVMPPDPEAVAREAEEAVRRGFDWLSELEPASVQHPYGNMKFDQSFGLGPLRIAGRPYARGLGTHAPAELRYQLDGNYARFEAAVGLDDSQSGGIGSVTFEVWVDDERRYASPVMRAGMPAAPVNVDVSGARVLRLVLTQGGDGDNSDHGDWADARLIRKRAPGAETPPPP